MSIKSDLENLASLVPVIKADRKYWLLRAEGGDFYQNFIDGNYVAIGYNDINFSDIELAKGGDRAGRVALTERIKAIAPREGRPGYVASQLIRFTYEIKKGDIVIVPSAGSYNLSFGEVQQTYGVTKENNDTCPYLKRKEVKWLALRTKYQIDAELYRLLFSHITISDAGDYANIIDRILHSVYKKGDVTHLVVPVNTTSKVPTTPFFQFGQIFELTKEICEEEGINIADDFAIKTKVQSVGTFEITNAEMLGVMALGIVLVAIVGGSFSFNWTKTNEKTNAAAKMVSVGLIEKISAALNRKSDRKIREKIVEKAAAEMKITTPDELAKLLEKLDEKK